MNVFNSFYETILDLTNLSLSHMHTSLQTNNIHEDAQNILFKGIYV